MNTILKKVVSLMLCLVLFAACLPVSVMAADVEQNPDNLYPGETATTHVAVQTTSQTPIRSEVYSVKDTSTGVDNYHIVSNLAVDMVYPKWVLHSYGNNGFAEFQMRPRFEPISIDGELGYQLLLDVDFFGKGDYANTVIYTTTLGDNDEEFTVTTYYGIAPGIGADIDKTYEKMKIVRITNKDASKIQEAGLTKGNSSNDNTIVNLGDGLDKIAAGQIQITKTVSGLESVDALKNGIYYIEVTGKTNEDLSYYKLDLEDAAATAVDGTVTYKWTIPVVPSNTEKAYEVKEHTYYIPGYTCTANYKVVHGDYSKTEGSGKDDETAVTVYTSRYGTVDFVNQYERAPMDTKDREYVIDFGLPVDFTLEDLKLTMLDEEGKEIPITDRGVQVTKLEIDAGAKYNYGAVELIADDEATEAYDPRISYTPNVIVNGSETIPVKLWVNGREKEDYDFNLVIYPATTVYYEEDGFVGFENSTAATQDSGFGIWTSPWGRNQTTEMLGEPENIYGYDPAYGECKTYSLGNAKSVTVNAATGKKGEAPYATFKFKGTGFDIVSLTDNTSGSVIVYVDGERVMTVDNYYGYDYNEETGEWEVNKENGANALYQVPVIKVEGLNYAEHIVKVEAAYIGAVDQTEDEGYTFWFDAVRIYDPMGDTIDNKYAQDGENDPQYKTVRDLVVGTTALDSDAELSGVVFIDGMDGTKKVVDYESQGPNNELYLAKGQSITFQVQVTGISDISKLSLDLGAKLATGESASLLLNNEEYINLATATDMYYDLGSKLNWADADGVYTANVILSNETEGSIISLTNLKVAGGAAFAEETAAAALSLEEAPVVRMMVSRSIANNAVAMLNASNVPEDTEPSEPIEPSEPEIPVEVFTPENVEAAWNTCSAGGYATLTVNTSMDVAALEVDGMAFTNVVEVPTVEIVDSQPILHYHKMWTIHIQMMTSGEQVCEIIAYNAEGISSEAIGTSVTIY